MFSVYAQSIVGNKAINYIKTIAVASRKLLTFFVSLKIRKISIIHSNPKLNITFNYPINLINNENITMHNKYTCLKIYSYVAA